MNVHHLELFFYVAKYEGITAAVRKMPYGIQQPAVSGQILQLEEQLGVKLFNRRPFALTPVGEELYDYVYPFFSQLSQMEERIKGEEGQHLRIAASATVLRNHLPEVLEDLKLEEPKLRLTLREVEPADIFDQLSRQQADVAVSLLDENLSDGMKSEELLDLPLILYVPESLGAVDFHSLIKKNPEGAGKIAKIPLVGLPPHEALSQVIEKQFRKLDIAWPVSVEVNSLDVIQKYVARGFGAGIGVAVPGAKAQSGVKQVLLTDFPSLKVGVIFQGSLKPMAEKFVESARARASQLRNLPIS